jgi:cyclase
MTSETTHAALIVARMDPGSADKVAEIFARSDRTELPGLVGVRRRSLFRYGDVYIHLVDGDRPMGPAIAAVREHPEFVRVSRELDAYVRPYDPATWRSPADAMAEEFYRWERP